MTEAEALARLGRMTDSATDPALTAADLADCLAMSKLVDSDGLAPTDDDWTPTFDLNRGAAEGWRRKAGKAAGRFDFQTDGQRFDRSQIVAHCQSQADYYRRKIHGTITVQGTMARSDD